MKKQTKIVEVLLHNIRSAHNVGSIFRTAETAGVSKIYISGYTPSPVDKFNRPRKDIAKVSLGAEKIITWECIKELKNFLKEMRNKGFQIIGLEQSAKSVDYKKIKITHPVLFLVGNEVDGIDPEILEMCDQIAEIPMRGEKESLNVSVAFGIGLFRLLNI
jgi:tRNA G18 (ribose-2'-O)-methylase SpoU